MNIKTNTPASKPLFTIRELTLIGVMTAVTCILGPLSFPIFLSPIPLTMGNLAIFLSVYVLGMKKGFISYLIYFLLGAVGLPVLSGFTGGLGKLAGPTGGYLIGFFLLALIEGFFVDRWHGRKRYAFAGMFLGSIACNLLGTVWLSRQLHISFLAGLSSGVFPYIPGDLAKMLMALVLGSALRKALRHL